MWRRLLEPRWPGAGEGAGPQGAREGALRPESGADPVRAEAGAGAGPPRAWEAGRSRIAWGGCWLVSGIGNFGAL